MRLSGVSIAMGYKKNTWMVFVRENPNPKWMITRGTSMTQDFRKPPYLGNDMDLFENGGCFLPPALGGNI